VDEHPWDFAGARRSKYPMAIVRDVGRQSSKHLIAMFSD
jgi:hypothetical protein